jgi:hypothetical protein
MDWLKIIIGGLVSTTSVIAATAFILRESFTRLLDKRLEMFKHELHLEATTRELTLKSQIEFKERQLSEFYGPIYARLKRGRTIVRLWKDGKLYPIDKQFWELARKTNQEIEDIILTKSHLIDGSEIPKSYIQFLTHVPLWHSFLDATGTVPPIDEFPEMYYAEDFENSVYETTERLKKELQSLYERFGLLTHNQSQS